MRPTRPEPRIGRPSSGIPESRVPSGFSRGFTLIEMVVVMTITGILAAIVAVFIQRPMEGLIDTTRRAELADSADTALRRMKRDLQRALPNSVRVIRPEDNPIVTGFVIEFLPTVSGGRYCTDETLIQTPQGQLVACNTLSLEEPDGGFDVIGDMPAFNPNDVREVAVYNLGIPGADAYAGNNTAFYDAFLAPELTVWADGRRAAGFLFPFASPGRRFHLIGGPVSYVCRPGNNGTGTLERVTGYAKTAVQSANPGAGNLLASNVAACAVGYDRAAIEQHGLVVLTLTLESQGERVTLIHQIEVNNVP